MTIRVIYLDTTAMVWAAGCLDGAVTAELHRVLDGLAARAPATVLLDLVEVEEIDDGAVAVLAATATRLAYQGGELELRLPTGSAVAVPDARTLRRALARAYPAGGEPDSA